MNKRTSFCWLELITGILMIVLGIITLIKPGSAVTGLVMLYAAAAIIMGVGDIVFYVKAERYTGFGSTVSLVSGIVSVMAGVMLLVYPNAGKWILSLLFPLWFIAHCIFQLANLSILRLTAGRFCYYFSMVTNILGLALGILMLFQPIFSILTVGFIIGFYLIMLGVDSVLMAVGMFSSRW